MDHQQSVQNRSATSPPSTGPVSDASGAPPWWCMCLMLIPCVTSLGFRWAGPRAATVAEPRERTSLVFNQYAVNLGDVPPARKVQGRFTMRNVGETPIKITRLEASCGCMQPRLMDDELSPGEVGRFFVSVDTALQKSGPREFRVTVHYTDPEPKTETVLFRITLPERRVVVQPRALVFYQFNERPTEQEVRVSDFRDAPLAVLNATCDSPNVTVRLGETVHDENGAQHTIIHVTVAGLVSEGMHEHLLRIETNDPKYRGLGVPLRIVGPAEVTPAEEPSQAVPSTGTKLER